MWKSYTYYSIPYRGFAPKVPSESKGTGLNQKSGDVEVFSTQRGRGGSNDARDGA